MYLNKYLYIFILIFKLNSLQNKNIYLRVNFVQLQPFLILNLNSLKKFCFKYQVSKSFFDFSLFLIPNLNSLNSFHFNFYLHINLWFTLKIYCVIYKLGKPLNPWPLRHYLGPLVKLGPKVTAIAYLRLRDKRCRCRFNHFSPT